MAGLPVRTPRRVFTAAVVAALLLVAASATAQPAAVGWRGKLGGRLDARLAALKASEEVRIGVVLRDTDLPGRRAAAATRRQAVLKRQQSVLDAPPTSAFGIRRRYQSLAGFSGWAGPAIIEKLAKHPDVLHVYIDGRVRAATNQGRPLVGAPQAYAAGYDGSTANVAVLDTGIDTDHADLVDDLVDERCWCRGSASPLVGCCPGGGDTQSGAGAAEDDEGHGTAVSGVITSGGAVAPSGVAPEAGVVAIKVLDSTGGGDFSDIAAALDWLLTNHVGLNVKVVNLSLGDGGEYSNPAASPCSGTNTANAIASLTAAGVAVFAAPGNDAHVDGISFPACVADAISVGGVYDAALGSVSWCGATCSSDLCVDEGTAADDFVCHTNSDEILDLLAPGYATFTSEVGGSAATFGGTSAASPYAAALALLLFEQDPSLTVAGLRTLMTTTGPLVTNPANGLSHRRTDVTSLFAICGNGTLELGESCDDGGTADGDCCSSSCQFEAPGSACDDGNACTAVDVCDGAGVCVPGPGLPCDDGLFCNGAESCDTLTGCQAGPPPVLDDGVACTVDACDEVADAVTHTPDDAACDDGAFCNGAETCDLVSDCQAGPPPLLDDGVACTVDACDEVADAVTHTPDDAACDDGAFCNGAETCDLVSDCQAGPPPLLDDGVACTVDACDEVGDEVTHAPDPQLCDDADPCTAEMCDAITGCSNPPIPMCGPAVPVGGAPFVWWVAGLIAAAGAWMLGGRR